MLVRANNILGEEGPGDTAGQGQSGRGLESGCTTGLPSAPSKPGPRPGNHDGQHPKDVRHFLQKNHKG